MILEKFEVGMLQTNCYLAGDEKAGRAFVIDPGGDEARIARRMKERGLEIAGILLTHAHFDHALGAWALKELVGGEIYMHPKDEPLLHDRMVGLGAVPGGASKTSGYRVDKLLKEGDRLEAGALRLEVLETPGHTPGHVSLYCRDERLVFVGDLLFAGSIGRTDFPGGSFEQLLRSVREKIFPLDGNTAVWPGHGPETTVEREKRHNPFFSD
jgi:glyoxylase-like metal-dependent hydrolase (beta-lactamase superfamily II)